MKKIVVLIIIAITSYNFTACSSDDNVPYKVANFKEEIIKEWTIEKKEFLDNKGKVILSIDYTKKKNCSTENWTFNKEEVNRKISSTNQAGNCNETTDKLSYKVVERDLLVMVPSQSTSTFKKIEISNFYHYKMHLVEKVNKEEITLSLDYPKGTQTIKYTFKR